MKRKTKLILIISGSVLLLLISGIFIYLNVYYKAVDVDNYLKSSDTVKVEEIKEGYMFDSASDKALIFYPGAKVDTKAYAPLCFQMAEKGFDVFLLDMPFHFAIFDINAANDIIKNYSYSSYYVGGHSLGGAMAANYAAKNASKLDGLLLLAAYQTKNLSSTDLTVLTIYGENDGVLNRNKIETGRTLMPKDSYEYEINGGNHAQFGSYGKQKNDNDATISSKVQIEETIGFIVKHFN